MEPIQGNHDRREPILRKITSDCFFPDPHSPFGQGTLFALTMAGNSSWAPYLLDAGPEG